MTRIGEPCNSPEVLRMLDRIGVLERERMLLYGAHHDYEETRVRRPMPLRAAVRIAKLEVELDDLWAAIRRDRLSHS